MAHRIEEPSDAILVVDDEPEHNEAMAWRLRREGFEVVVVETVADCLAAVSRRELGAVFLDYSLGKESGIEILHRLRNAKSPAELPVIMVTAESASETMVSALRAGANDYITKPVDLDVMVQRLRTQLSLRTVTRDLERRALYDQLTGLPNRTLLVDRLDGAFARCSRSGDKIAVLFMDLDGFKRVNDMYGHVVGDLLLASVAQRLAVATRSSETVGRLGGDEFIVVIERVRNFIDVETVARRIEQAVCHPHDIEGHKIEVGVSIGSYLWQPGDTVDVTTAIQRADAAMYGQKRQRKAS